MSVVVVATIRPLPEHREEVVAALTETIPLVHAEDGCELYALHEADDRLVMIEKWASPAALAVHGKAAALSDLRPRLEDKLSGPMDVQVLEAVPAGEASLGAL